jgi:glutathione S-transferase
MLTFYHSPNSRAFSILWLLEELGQPYRLELVDIRAEDGPPESYRAIQPHKKVPAIVDGDIVVTERAAIALYLTERFPQAGLAPAAGDPGRAGFLTALVYSDAVLDPIIATSIHEMQYPPRGFSFGSKADTIANLTRKLSEHPYAAGERFTAADTQLGSGIHFGMNIAGVLPRLPAFEAYMARMIARPALQRTIEIDRKLTEGDSA